jgi:hypothetical protein
VDAVKEVHRLICRGHTDVVDADLSRYLRATDFRSSSCGIEFGGNSRWVANPRSHDERVSAVAQRTYVAAARAIGENPRGAYRFVGDGDGCRKSPKAESHAGLSLEGAVAGLSGRLFRHPGAMRMRSTVVRGIGQEFICNAAIAAPSDLLDLSLGVPSAFSRLDMTHFDVLALGRQFLAQYPDRSHPVLLLGSYGRLCLSKIKS